MQDQFYFKQLNVTCLLVIRQADDKRANVFKETNTLQELARKLLSVKDYCICHSYDRELTLGVLFSPTLKQLLVALRHTEALVRGRSSSDISMHSTAPSFVFCSTRGGSHDLQLPPGECLQSRSELKLLSHRTSFPELSVLARSRRITSPCSSKRPAGSPWQLASAGSLRFQKPKL